MIYVVRAWPLKALTRPRLGLVGCVSDMVVGTSEFPPMQLSEIVNAYVDLALISI